MKIFALIGFLFFAAKSNAQLPSEKPVDEIYSPVVKQKLQATKAGKTSRHSLPSNAALPKQATAAKRTTSTTAVFNKQEFRRQLPSNSDNMLPVTHPPKKTVKQ